MADYPRYNAYVAQPYAPQMAPYQAAWQQPVQQMPSVPQAANFAPQQPQAAQQVPIYQMRPVTGQGEILAAQVDFNGAPLFGWDMARGAIYMRQFNVNTGAADFTVFRRETPTQEATPQYVTIQQLEERLAEIERRYNHAQPNVDAAQYDAAGADGAGHARRRKPDAGRGPDGAE